MIALAINGKSYNVDVESDTPLLWVLRDTIGDPRALRTPKLPTFREQCGDETQESSCTSAENKGKHPSLTLVGAFVDKDAGGPLGPSRP